MNNNEFKVVVTNEAILEKINKVENPQEYFDYLMKLDYELNGTDQISGLQYGVKEFLKKRADKDNEECKESKLEMLEAIKAYLDSLLKHVPEVFRNTYEYNPNGDSFIPEDDTLFTVITLVNRLIALEK